MNREEIIRLFEEQEAPESIIKQIEEQHEYFVNNLLTRCSTMTKELYLKFLNERIEKASQAIQDSINLQAGNPNDGLFNNRLLVYRLCQLNIAFAMKETKKKHTPGPNDTEYQFKDIFTGVNKKNNALGVIALLKAKGFIINRHWVNPDENKKSTYYAIPLHVLQDNGIIQKKPVAKTALAWCKGIGIEPTCTVKALTKRRKGGAKWEAENDSEYQFFYGIFASILNQ